jgi:hypothetical protein
MKTDDGDLLFIEYSGVVVNNREVSQLQDARDAQLTSAFPVTQSMVPRLYARLLIGLFPAAPRAGQ